MTREGGTEVPADLVVAGIAVDATLATSAPDIFAAGDCCSFPAPLYGGRRIRPESWRSAQEQGALAARNMLGAGQAISGVPWSDQYDLTLQIAGLADGAETLVRRDGKDGTVLLFHLAPDGRLLAAAGIGPGSAIAKEIRLAEMLIAKSATPDPVAQADPSVNLKKLLRGLRGDFDRNAAVLTGKRRHPRLSPGECEMAIQQKLGVALTLQSFWAMERRHADGLERSLEENVAMIADAGFDGVATEWTDREAVMRLFGLLGAGGLTTEGQCFPKTIDDPKPVLRDRLRIPAPPSRHPTQHPAAPARGCVAAARRLEATRRGSRFPGLYRDAS